MWFLTLIGLMCFPRFTLGCILVYYNHPLLGTIAIVLSLIEYKTK